MGYGNEVKESESMGEGQRTNKSFIRKRSAILADQFKKSKKKGDVQICFRMNMRKM